MLVYGTLYPLQYWQFQALSPNSLLRWPVQISGSDSFTNLIIYLPLGFLFATLLSRRFSVTFAILISMVVGASLSFLLEFTQVFLPTRVSSLLDVTLNSAGSLLGALVSVTVFSDKFRNSSLSLFSKRQFFYSIKSTIVFVAIVLWLFAELIPLVPAMSLADLFFGFQPFWLVLQQPALFDWVMVVNYFLIASLFWLLVFDSIREKKRLVKWAAIFIIFFAVMKIIIVSRQLYIEAVLGLIIGLLVMGMLFSENSVSIYKYSNYIVGMCALLVICIGVFKINQLATNSINWIPFHFHIQGTGFRFPQLIQQIWPFTVLSYIGYTFFWLEYTSVNMMKTGVFVLGVAMSLELIRLNIFGEYADVTNVFLALMGWFVFYLVMSNSIDDSCSLKMT